MRYAEGRLPAPHDSLVAGFWLFEKQESEEGLDLDFAWPEAGGSLVFTLDEAVSSRRGPLPRIALVAGIRSPEELRIPGRARILGLRFRSGGMRALLGVSPAEVGGIDELGGAWARRLAERLALSPGDVSRAAHLLDAALSERSPDDSGLILAARAEVRFARTVAHADFSDLANECHCSLRSLQRCWPEASGYCPCEYRAVLRCEMARVALFSDPGRELSELALHLGFCDLPHFCRTFRRWSHATPDGYRRFVEPYRLRFAHWGATLLPLPHEAPGEEERQPEPPSRLRASPTALSGPGMIWSKFAMKTVSNEPFL